MPQYLKKISLSICLILTNYTHLFAQQTHNKQDGIYKTYQEFLDNKPSITKPFKLTKDTTLDYNEYSEKMDTVLGKLKYAFTDGSKLVSDIWGLCDSGKVYIKLKDFNIAPITHLGKYPYTYFVRKRGFAVFLPSNIISLGLAAGLTLASGAIAANSPGDLVLAYIDEKGNCYEIDAPRLFKLLKPQKDLYDAFWDEKKKNKAVYEKYLSLLNERYPANP